MPDEMDRGTRIDEPYLEINNKENESGGVSTLVFTISIIFIVLVSGFFVFYKYRTDSQANDKQQAFNLILDQLQTKENKAIEAKANNINSAVKIITTASKTKYSFKGFIDELTKKITNDTKLNSLSISDAGVVTFDGTSATYRSVADLALALKSSSKLENVEIAGLTRSSDQGTSQVTFSMTAQIKDWKAESAVDSTADSTSDESIGGTSE